LIFIYLSAVGSFEVSKHSRAKLGGRRQEAGGGRWEVGGGRWEMGDGRWEMGDGRWEIESKTDVFSTRI